ncbi:hypothetical protein D4Q76_01425 [archaeon]|nr:MAG: hypothetical protein D4Q76_01425 [archaeon]
MLFSFQTISFFLFLISAKALLSWRRKPKVFVRMQERRCARLRLSRKIFFLYYFISSKATIL